MLYQALCEMPKLKTEAKEPTVLFFSPEIRSPKGRDQFYQFLWSMVSHIPHYRPRVLAGGLFGFKEITLDHLHMARWNYEHGQVNVLELPCLAWWSQAKFGYLNSYHLRINSKKFSSSVAPAIFQVLPRPHLHVEHFQCRAFYWTALF